MSEHFYSRPDESGRLTLDEIITELEGDLDGQVKSLRQLQHDTAVDSAKAAPLVVHLALRTAHIRSILANAFTTVVDEVGAIFSDPSQVRSLLGIDALDPGNLLKNAIHEAIKRGPLAQADIPPALALRIGLVWAREQFEKYYNQDQKCMAALFELISDSVSEKIQDAHNAALAKGMGGEQRAQAYSEFNWKVEETENAILSDAVVLGIERDQTASPLLLARSEEIDLIVLPIAHDRVLVGRKSMEVQFDSSRYNAGAAACSEDFFISRTPGLSPELGSLIGTRTSNALSLVISDVLENTRRKANARLIEERKVKVTEASVTPSFTYTFSCSDLPEHIARRLGSVIDAVIDELGRSLPLSNLDGISVAADYEATLRNLGINTPSVLELNSHEAGISVANIVDVRRDGVTKAHVVLRHWVGHGLIADKLDERAPALRILVKMLAQIAHNSLHGKTANGEAREPVPMANVLHCAVAYAPRNYYSSKIAAGVAPNFAREYADLAMSTLECGRKEVLEARHVYRSDSNLDQLLMVSLPWVGAILDRCADWLGHVDGLPKGQGYEDGALREKFSTVGLGEWLDLYGRDLRALYETSDALSIKRVFMLDQHVERLLWLMGLFPWPLPDGGTFVTVRLDDLPN